MTSSSSVSLNTNMAQYNCDWSQFPVTVDGQSQVSQKRTTIVAISDQSRSNPINTAGLDETNLCNTATTVDKEFCRAMQKQNDSLEDAAKLNKNRKRSFSRNYILNVSRAWKKLTKEFRKEHGREPLWWESIWIAIQLIFRFSQVSRVFSNLFPQKEHVHENNKEKKVRENCRKLEQQISGLKLRIQQIQTFVESYKQLDDVFQEVLRKNSDQFVLTTVPVLEVNRDDPYDYQYILTREFNHSKRQIREIIKFIAFNTELWDCFIYYVQKTKLNDMKKLFNLIFQLLKENIDKSDYQSIKKLLTDEVQELKESHFYNEKFIRRILLKLSGSVFDFQFFSEQLLVKKQKADKLKNFAKLS